MTWLSGVDKGGVNVSVTTAFLSETYMKEWCHFVYVFLFQIVEVGQPTDGQKKAEKIKASFQNPFQKVRCRYYYQVPVSFYNF